MLPHERSKDEVIYFPNSSNGQLEAIKVADGQHLIESMYDKVFSQRALQTEIYDFVKSKLTVLSNPYVVFIMFMVI